MTLEELQRLPSKQRMYLIKKTVERHCFPPLRLRIFRKVLPATTKYVETVQMLEDWEHSKTLDNTTVHL